MMYVAVKLTRLSNYLVTDNQPFPYDTAVVLDTDYATWAGEGEPLVIVQAGWYWLHLNTTTLGKGYSNAPSNADWLQAVGRNGITLADTIYSQRCSTGNPNSAQLMSGGTPVHLAAGDRLRAYYQNLVYGETKLLVESNPTDGPNYLTDIGTGTLSPHLFLIAMTGAEA